MLHLLVDDDTDGRLGNVVNNAGLSVVDLVWHTLLDGTVGDDVNDISDPVSIKIRPCLQHGQLTCIGAGR